jgi:small subunit ribosomal protein S4
MSPSIPAARQLVSHGHVLVNGLRVDRASYAVRPGAIVSLRARASAMQPVIKAWASPPLEVPKWISRDVTAMTARIAFAPVGPPPFEVQTSLVVEYYAPRV